MNIFLLSGLVSMSVPAGCGVYAATRWALDRHAMTLAFTKPRERRRNPWRQ